MFNNFTAALGAILLSTACIATAVGPAAANERAPVQVASVVTSAQLNS